jgi:hypothetical protein
LARRLVEARKAKQEAKKKELEEEKRLESLKNPIKPKGRPWYYIGDIPKGYREATETEAIENNKISKYGKYQVDDDKYRLWVNYEILLDEHKGLQEVIWSMNGLKRRILKSLQDIEIYSSKLDNDKYKDRKDDFNHKLIFEKERRKYLQAGYNWYYKLFCSMKGIKYERQKIELPKKEINEKLINEKENINSVSKIATFKRPIDPRTGKEAIYSNFEGDDGKVGKTENKDINVNLMFKKDDDTINLSTKYFTDDYKLKNKYVKKLLDKNIVLAKKHYNTDAYNENFYHMIGNGVYKLI